MIPHSLHNKGYFWNYDEKITYFLLFFFSFFFFSFNRKNLKLLKIDVSLFAFKLFKCNLGQQNYLVIGEFCYIRPLTNEVPLYHVNKARFLKAVKKKERRINLEKCKIVYSTTNAFTNTDSIWEMYFWIIHVLIRQELCFLLLSSTKFISTQDLVGNLPRTAWIVHKMQPGKYDYAV